MNPIDVKRLLDTEPDFIGLKRFDFSLKKLLEEHPDGCSDKMIAQALLIPETEVEGLYQKVVDRLRVLMRVTE